MTDIFSEEKRSIVMSLIKSRDNESTEKKFIRALRAYGITGWRRNQKLIGRPDFVFRKQKVVVFLDGCFWHMCELHCKIPQSNRNFWEKKLNSNKLRDIEVTKTLEKSGWSVIRIWEHDMSKRRIGQAMDRLRRLLNNGIVSNPNK
jgi:DNA mismatch endonuclease (patch repair protein)